MMSNATTHTKRHEAKAKIINLAGCCAVALAAMIPAPVAAAPLKLTAEQAVARALKKNLSLQVDRLSPTLSDAAEKRAAAAFEPALYTRVDVSGSPGKVSTQRAGLEPTSTTSVGGSAGVRKTFSTGTSVDLSISSDALFGGGGLDPAYQSGVALSARQPLLRGVSRSANLSGIDDARMAREAAKRELARKAEQVAASALEAYFDLQAALAADRVATVAIQTSEAALDETRKLIAAGKLPPSEEVSARYALQTQQRDRLKTAHAVSDARDRLARLIGLVEPGSLQTPEIVTVDVGVTPATLKKDAGSLAALLASAFDSRGDLLAAEQEIARQQAKLSASRHQLLPSLDLVGSVYVTGLSGDATGTGDAGSLPSGYLGSISGMDQVGWSVGLVFELPLGNDRAEADVKSAELGLRRARVAADAVRQQIAEELNRAWRAVSLARDQLALTELAAEVAATKLKNAEALYRAGKSSGHDLATIRAQTVAEQLAQAEDRAALNKAVARLHAAAGDLLSRMKLS